MRDAIPSSLRSVAGGSGARFGPRLLRLGAVCALLTGGYLTAGTLLPPGGTVATSPALALTAVTVGLLTSGLVATGVSVVGRTRDA